jgi:hypothetical protein
MRPTLPLAAFLLIAPMVLASAAFAPAAFAQSAAPQAAAPATSPATATASPTAKPQNHKTRLEQRFAAANATHDGHLTRAQAESGMPKIAKHFDAIDTAHKGYVTLDEIRAYRRAMRKQHAMQGGGASSTHL